MSQANEQAQEGINVEVGDGAADSKASSYEGQLQEIVERKLSEREERIARMVARGISQKDIAASENVTDGLISQILNTNHVRTRIANLRAETLGKDMIYDDLLDQAQKKTLVQVDKLVSTLDDPLKASRVLHILDNMKRRVDPNVGANGSGVTNIVNITIPAGAMVQGIIHNAKRQVSEVNGIPLISAGVANFMEKQNERKKIEANGSPVTIENSTGSTGQRFGPEDL